MTCVVNDRFVSKSGDGSVPVGWIEKDGKQSDHPTDDDEDVYVGDTVDVHVEVHVNPCYSWSVRLPVCLCFPEVIHRGYSHGSVSM